MGGNILKEVYSYNSSTEKTKKVIKIFEETYNDSNDGEVLFSLMSLKDKVSKINDVLIQNTLKFIFYGTNQNNFLFKIKSNIKELKQHYSQINMKINSLAINKIKNGTKIFLPTYSQLIVSLLKKAKKKGINFEVLVLESRPKNTGKKLSEELANVNIKVSYYLDSNVKEALINSDLMLFSYDRIMSNGEIISNTGCEMYSEMANKYNVPVYAIGNSWKFNFKNKLIDNKDNSDYIWKNPPKNIEIKPNYYGKINPNNIQGIITEIGIYKPINFILEIGKFYPWLIN